MTAPQQERAIHLVVKLLVASLTASVGFAVLTLLFHSDVLAYQQARDPGADPGALAATLWTRPIPIVVVAALYVVVIRQLLAGAPRAYRRVRIVSAAGFLAVAWLFVSAAYPVWLRGVQAVQLVLLAALIVAVNRRVVREAFPAVPDPRPRNRRAAWLLVVLAPFVAEVSLGNLPLSQLWAILFFVPMYGGGALFIREVARRTGASILLLGIAYGLVEEGLVLQSLTSSHLYGAADWAPRLFGVNSAYTLLNLVYHPVFSIAIPIALVEFVFARHGTAPYLRRGGLIATGVIALLGAAQIRVTVPPMEDPGYTMPPAAVIVVLVLVVAVSILALRWRARPVEPAEPPRIALLATGTAVVTFVFLAMLWPFAGAEHSLFTPGGPWSLLPVAGAAVVVGLVVVAFRCWTAAPSWTSRHTFAACIGALADAVFLAAITAATIALGVRGLCGRRAPRLAPVLR